MAKGRFRQAVEAWYDDFDLGGRFSRFSEEKTGNIEKRIIKDHREIFDLLDKFKNSGTGLDGYVKRTKEPTGFAQIILILLGAVGAVLSIMSGFFQAIQVKSSFILNRELRPTRLSPSEAWQADLKSSIHSDKPIEHLKDLGYDDEIISLLFAGFEQRLPIGETITLFRRGLIGQEELEERIVRAGFSFEDIGPLLSATEQLPGLSDILSLAVRDVFDERAVERFQLGAEFPQAFQKLMNEIGVRQDMPDLLWKAHWRLPSIGQGFEMFQRLRPGRTDNPFTIDDLGDLLKVADISPFFMPLLREIALRPVVSIDVSRLFREGLIDDLEMTERNMDFGYSPENAAKLTEMEVRQGQADERDLTLGLIKKAYAVKQITRHEANQSLLDLRFDAINAELILDIIDFDIQQDQLTDLKRHLELVFVEGEVGETQVRNRLASAGATSGEVNDYVQKITIRRARKIKIPSKSELEDFYEDNIIEVGQLRNGLTNLGWTNERVLWFVQLVDLKIQKKLQKEADKARSEQNTLARRSGTRSYQLAKAEIDTLIAEHNADIADIKVARHLIDEDDEEINFKLAIDEIKAEIALLKLDKALIRVEFLN